MAEIYEELLLQQDKLSSLITLHNTALGVAASGLANYHEDATIGVLDLFTPFSQMVLNETGPGFAMPIEEPCYGPDEYEMPGTPNLDECADPDERLFWDWLHPSTQAHSVLGISLLQGLSGAIVNSALLHARQQTVTLAQIIKAEGSA